MEYYQAIQNRTGQTVAVINQYVPTLKAGATDAAALLALADGLNPLAQARDNALTDYDAAVNGENQGFLGIQRLTLALPQAAEGELDDTVITEAALIDLLDPAYAIVPRTTELALGRGKKVVSAVTKINTFLAAQVPVRGPITAGGKGVTDLTSEMNAQPAKEQTVEDRAVDVTDARTALRTAATHVDRLNKRFFAKLEAEARTNPALAEALLGITTGASLPGTLGILSILQGGVNGLQLLVSYENGTYTSGATSTVEWMVEGVDTDFTHTAPADPSGNALGPFTIGQVVKLRTRVANSNGTTTGSIRTLTILNPAA
ncbi:MAG: hypothetical protein B9S33_18795 [Pedosphaera sp. Tous-C6FEB]|nr:MAG: hypothetical protein B9S33_18795 [Pedosphaera sp. Tous-C6FEB]